MKYFVIVFFIFTFNLNYFSQDTKVTLTVIGHGINSEKAKTAALRNAIEQAYGVFISSKTELLNDDLIKDEIVSISNGNIEHFEVLSETKMADGNYSNVVKATVSIAKLTKFCENKGMTCELKGALFAANAKIQMLNKQSEEFAFKNLYDVAIELGKNIYDYNMTVSEPQVNKGYVKEYSSGNATLKFIENSFYVNVYVKSKLNKNLNNIVSIFEKTLKSISLSESEKSNLKGLGLEIYQLQFNGSLYLVRSSITIQILEKLFLQNTLRYYASKFYVSNGVNNEFTFVDYPYHGFIKPTKSSELQFSTFYHDKIVYSVNPSSMEPEISFWLANVLTMDELSKVKEFSIKPSK